MCAKRRLAAFLLVLLVASCYVWAFPGRKEQAIQADSTQAEMTYTKSGAMKESNDLEKDLKEPATSLKENDYSKQELKDIIEEQYKDQMEAEEDNQRLREENETLSAANAKQADDLAYTRGQLDKASSVKAFANLKAVIGFEDKLPTWGLGGDFGLRFKSGLMLSAGATYILGDFKNPIDFSWDLDSLSMSMGIGWEW